MIDSNISERLSDKIKDLVSVIIPTYGARGALDKAVDSVLNQTYPELEIIVVDDNPPASEARHKTESIMAKYRCMPNVRYIKHLENKNGAAARNTGIKNSNGSFIAFLDDDDIFYPSKISSQTDYLKSHPEYDGVYCQAVKRGNVISRNLPEGNLAKKLLLIETYMFTPSLLFRSGALKTINGFDESFRRHQDYELLLKYFNHGFRIGAVQEPLIEIGVNNGENVLIGKDFENTKERFLNLFHKEIMHYNNELNGFKNKVYARHYSSVFLGYLKSNQLPAAFKIFNRFFWKSPVSFLKPILTSLYYHLSIK